MVETARAQEASPGAGDCDEHNHGTDRQRR